MVLTDSVFSKHDLIELAKIPEAKIEVLYPWVGNEFLVRVPQAAVQSLRERLALPHRFWLYLGGYDYRKNVEFLIDAYKAASKARSLPPLVLAGKIPDDRNVATCNVRGALIRNSLTSEDIRQPGLISSHDLPALYTAASLLIYPSLMEGFGLPPAEAIAVGTPVLSSNAGSLPEVVRNDDCLFDPRNVLSLVEKLVAAADNEAQFSTKLSETFTETTGIDRYLELMGQVACRQ
jgi:glycosyltransferase involved in cell wall biosynthesis